MLRPTAVHLDVTARRQLGLDPTRAHAAQEPCSRLVCVQSSAKGVLGAFLVNFSHGRPTSRHHFLPSRSRFHPLPLLALAPPVNASHTATDRRLRPRRLQSALRSGSTPLRVRRRTGDPGTLLPHCPLYAIPRATLFSSLRLTSPSLANLLSNPRATKATLRFLADSGRFESLYCPPSEDPLP
jgi:hypothetical protein